MLYLVSIPLYKNQTQKYEGSGQFITYRKLLVQIPQKYTNKDLKISLNARFNLKIIPRKIHFLKSHSHSNLHCCTS